MDNALGEALVLARRLGYLDALQDMLAALDKMPVETKAKLNMLLTLKHLKETADVREAKRS